MIETAVIVGVVIPVVVSIAIVIVLLWMGYRNRERSFRDFLLARERRAYAAKTKAADSA